MNKRLYLVLPITLAVVLVGSPAAYACGGLIGPNGNVNLLRTTTMAGYADGVEHYVTSFSFAGGGGEFGSLVPLPDVPTKVERGGDWTLQRLIRETQPQPLALQADRASAAGAESAEVILETTIDALEITVVKGGGDEVGRWAADNGFNLPPDAPEVLDFYARRSPIFMAARFDADAARERGQNIGEGTPIHLTIPTDNPWVPLRILALGKQEQELIQADVYLLTEGEPELSPLSPGLTLSTSRPASRSLLADLSSDRGMDWMPRHGMWLSYLRVDAPAGELTYDLAAGVQGREPSLEAAGLVNDAGETEPAGPAEDPELRAGRGQAGPLEPASSRSGIWMLAGAAATVLAVGAALGRKASSSA